MELTSFIGTRIVNATEMSRGYYNMLQGWKTPENENHHDLGYLVEYKDSVTRNHKDFDFYITWLPKEEFDSIYKKCNSMNFGLAIEALKKGKTVHRSGWNGKGMYLFLIQGSNDIAKLHGYGFGEYLNEPTFRDAIFMRTVDNQLVPWTASQTDILAEDWKIYSLEIKND